MAIEHNVISDAERHEPKGLSTATSGQVYVASGSDVGVWGNPLAADTTIADAGGYYTGTTVEVALQELGSTGAGTIQYLQGVIADISTPSSILIPLPADCVISTIDYVLGGAITLVDAIISITRGGDSAIVHTGTTVAFTGSAEGDVDSTTPTGNATVVKATHKYLKVTTDGASTDAATVSVMIKVTI